MLLDSAFKFNVWVVESFAPGPGADGVSAAGVRQNWFESPPLLPK